MKLFQLSWHSSDETEIVWQLSPHCLCVRFLNENQKQGCKIQRLFYIFGTISCKDLTNELQFLHKDKRGPSRRWWWNCVWTHQEPLLLPHRLRHSCRNHGRALRQSTARWCLLSTALKGKASAKRLKFHSDRRWWHLLSSADMPSRNTVQGQLILQPRVHWNSNCHKTNLCKLGFTKK